MKSWIIGVLAVMTPLQVAAQHSSKNALASLGFKVVEPMPPKQTADTKAKVDAELSKAGVSSLFDNITDANGGKAKHLPSGLVCPLGKKGQRVTSASADGATCETRNGDISYFTTVMRAPAGTDLRAAATNLLSNAEKEDGYAPYQGTSVTAHPNAGFDRPDHQTIRFVSRVDGHKRASVEQVGVIRGWVLTVRKVSPSTGAQPSMMGDILEEASFGTSMAKP